MTKKEKTAPLGEMQNEILAKKKLLTSQTNEERNAQASYKRATARVVKTRQEIATLAQNIEDGAAALLRTVNS